MVQGIDLGQLQRDYTTAAKADKAARRALERAQTTADASRKGLEKASEALRTASRAVLE